MYLVNSTSAKSSIGFSWPAPDASAPFPGKPAYLRAATVQGPHNVCDSPCTLSNWLDCAISQTHPAGDRISAIDTSLIVLFTICTDHSAIWRTILTLTLPVAPIEHIHECAVKPCIVLARVPFSVVPQEFHRSSLMHQ